MYLMEEATAGELADSDPFGGAGVFLPVDADAQEILDTLERVLGVVVPAVAWPFHGAWVDSSAVSAEVLGRWES